MHRWFVSIRVWVITVAVGLWPVCAMSGGGMVLDCDRYDGDQTFQIYVNELEGYVLYNAQHRKGDYSREREYSRADDPDRGTVVIDEGLDIYQNGPTLIRASSNDASFVLAKETATYAYAWTTPFPRGDGKLVAFGNNHTGRCLQNPWQQPSANE